ncbi:MAG TPA: acetyl-CoA carboxylase biotin carboxylase subunit [Victivallales bacterium]|nr:acetyl-CoA carboxylase biotin carboxylase subunit [Victivallales bacterium]HRR05792.1 acetyl-CoA carboxylase biotin carboxylase subunit [Victivallales bacterium]HRR28290.1 acetyl-CoA carboxylase biotin carboxylase subunit [Victivallales bacterium]HRU02034.1 acetyl-CoA carboxylase biotin carboxylase subunit [Victivallales bacterium]
MFRKILIANRGEIALRIIRACKELGIRSVAVHSKADSNSLHVHLADESVCIGESYPSSSYLQIPQIISAAEICDVDAIHPGYGFLAENAHFAEICESCNIKFIGPGPSQIRAMGDKVAARQTMKKAGVPTTPGSDGAVADEKDAKKLAAALKYPVIIKAAAGGGGKGMRIAHNEASLIQGFHAARSEAEKAFGNPEVYIEKYIEKPRHIEIQILADSHGNVVHLGERDCSIQRRHQKLIEESPSPFLTPDLRKKMGNTAIKAASSVGYTNAGTVEFLVDSNKNFYFMEMNTRIQVEHPVTEEITGIDLVKEQILIAAGEKLSFKQKNISFNGHAIECRINAENPYNNFSPCPGKVNLFHQPGGKGIRIDSHVYSGYSIPPYYDSMIAKLIVHAENRKIAIAKAQRALDEFIIEGIATTIPFSQFVLSSKEFVTGDYDTGFIENAIKDGRFSHK